MEGRRHLEQEFGLDQEFEIVELEPRRAASPDGQVVIAGTGSGGSGGAGSGGVGSGGVAGSGSVGSGGAGSGGGSGT
jgi:hypothetical protein